MTVPSTDIIENSKNRAGMKIAQRLMLKTIGFLTFLFLLPSVGVAQVTVSVSPIYSAIEHKNSVKLMPSDNEIFNLFQTPLRDAYTAIISIDKGPLRIIAIDGRDVAKQNPNPVLLLDKIITKSEIISLPGIPSKDGVTIALSNYARTPIYLNVTVYRTGNRPASVVADMRAFIEIPFKSLGEVYNLPAFNVEVRPCGRKNAYSNPNIILCTEMIANMVDNGFTHAVQAVLLHEVAHSLLYLWGLPGYNNEDLADEFSVIILSIVDPKANDDLIKYLESNDSYSEAAIQLVNGDRHTISIQRARNVKKLMQNPKETLDRWSRMLAPYAKAKRK